MKISYSYFSLRYGGEAASVTGEAMGAAGNTAQAIWNVRKLGPKAIVKSTARETGKAMLDYENPEEDQTHPGNFNKKGGGMG